MTTNNGLLTEHIMCLINTTFYFVLIYLIQMIANFSHYILSFFPPLTETLPHEEVFTIYLGSFASDVELIAIKLNENYLLVTDAIQQNYFITKISHINGTHGFIIKVPFEDKSVNRVVRVFTFIYHSHSIIFILFKKIFFLINSIWVKDFSSTLWKLVTH